MPNFVLVTNAKFCSREEVLQFYLYTHIYTCIHIKRHEYHGVVLLLIKNPFLTGPLYCVIIEGTSEVSKKLSLLAFGEKLLAAMVIPCHLADMV